MTNSELLKQKIQVSGLRPKIFYERLGISRSAWYKKLNGESPFKVEEITIVCEILNIKSLREKEQIFFAKV